MDLYIYNNGQRVAKTSQLIEPKISKGLMAQWLFSFALINSDKTRQYIIPDASFEIEGQKFDILRFKNSSGTENLTIVDAEHVSYRTINYKIEPSYSKIGTVSEIIADILSVSNCTEFTVGTCADIGTVTWTNPNAQLITVRMALFLLAYDLGIEIDYDNFIINAPLKIGADRGKVFAFGKDLTLVERIWDKSVLDSNGNPVLSYSIDGASLYRAGYDSEYFEVGDTVTVKDDLMGYEVKVRIVTYDKSLDTPLGDKVVLATYYPKLSDSNATISIELKKKMVEGQAYNNVSIDRTDGFKCIRNDNGVTVKMNAVDGFVVLNSNNEITGGIDNQGRLISTILKPIGTDEFYAEVNEIFNEFNTSEGFGLKLYQKVGSSFIEKMRFYINEFDTPSIKFNDGMSLIVNDVTAFSASNTARQIFYQDDNNLVRLIVDTNGVQVIKNGNVVWSV